LELRPEASWDTDELVFTCRGVLIDETLLKSLFDLFCTALARLDQMDAAPHQANASRVTPVYEKPDGWSDVISHLPENAAVTVLGTEGNFLKVSTADHVIGYISRSAGAHVISTPGN
jgi:hypothetical protein